MKAVVFHGVGDIRVDEVPEPRLEQPTDAVVRLTASSICSTDLHLVRGTIPGMPPVSSRLETARAQGAETINYAAEDPVETILRLTQTIGVDRVVDAVGIDANAPRRGPAAGKSGPRTASFKGKLEGDNWHPGDSPSQALTWTLQCIAKAGTLSIIGVYPPAMRSFPIGQAMLRHLTIKMGNCNQRKYIPRLVNAVRSGLIDPLKILTRTVPLVSAVEAYKMFDLREAGWMKVELEPARATAGRK